MSNLAKNSATGNLLKNVASGNLANGGCAECANCDFDYEQYQITFSGITSPTQNFCYAAPTPAVLRSAKMTSVPTANAMFTLTRTGLLSGCHWRYNPTGGSYGYTLDWRNRTCTGGSDDEGTLVEIVVILRKLSAVKWDLVLRFVNELGGAPNWTAFGSEKTVNDGDCLSVVMDNDLTGGIGITDGNEPNFVGDGGIATIVPV